MTDQQKAIQAFSLLILLFLFLPSTGRAQTLSMQTPSDSLAVGDLFTLSITYQGIVPYEKVIFPDSSSFIGDIEYLSDQHFKVTDFSDSTLYQLQFFGIENVTVPPLPVRIVSENDTTLLFTEPFELVYKQTIISAEDEFKPLKPIFDFPRAIWPYLVGLLILAIIGYLIWSKYFRETEENEQVLPIEIPVFENPLATLEQLLLKTKENHNSLVEKDYKAFYSELGDALRWYIEESYKIPALESTTREVLRYMDAFGVDVEMVKHTRKVLNEADMIKFAKFTPTLDQSWNAFHEGYSFLDRAKIVDIQRVERMRKDFEDQFLEEELNGMG